MKFLNGDLWDFHDMGWKIVISTNIGWTERRPQWARFGGHESFNPSGQHFNNMGAGIAAQAQARWPWLPEWLGSHYRARHIIGATQRPVEHDRLRLIFVPVKPLKENDPAYSWNQKADAELIRQQLGMLSEHQGKIALGYVGCGNGGLPQGAILDALLKLEIVRKHKGHGQTVVVDREHVDA